MSDYQGKITRHSKRQKTQFEETEHVRTGYGRDVRMSDQELKTVMTIS